MTIKWSWWVYILKCVDGTFYTGITTDMSRRLTQHNTGKGAKYTRGRGPCEFHVMSGPYFGRGLAQKVEHWVKKQPRSWKEFDSKNGAKHWGMLRG